MKETETKERKNYFLGFSILFILLSISRIVLIYHDFFAPDYIGSIHLDVILWKIGSILFLIGFIIMNYIIETRIFQKTKNIFTILGVVSIILYTAALDKTIATIILYIGFFSLIFLPLIIYIIMFTRTKGVLKKRVAIIILGMTTILVGSANNILVLFGLMEKNLSLMIGPPIILLGFIILWYGLGKISTEEKSEPDLIKIKDSKNGKSRISMIETLTGYKPQDLTEEQVTFYREQKICLVCKGKAGGFNIFVCITCDALYCQNCALVLSELENTCWVCNSAIDDSKPVKVQVKEEEVVEITGQKKGKDD